MKTYPVQYSADLDLIEGVCLSDFQFPWLERKCPETEFCAVWNAEWFKFQFQVEDHDIVMFEGANRDESVLGSDRVELFFATDALLKGPYYGLEMDPRGWVYDYSARHYRDFDPSWIMPNFELSAEVIEAGYSVEGKIGLETLRGLGCLVDGEMVTGVYRGEFSHSDKGDQHDWISWVNPGTESPDFHLPESFGKFLFVE
tara:strand:+ start:1010 stop:1609 length:600 start_codon:yes stop_codon:yes gene_type:complete